ncbi:MAG: hydrogenase maturation protease [Methanomassiliicoccales archaeon]|jgi:hydrogenase maturation protease|nr:hydrogenase maturation protease [Methanomassiliicoccales archaeon]
MVSSERKKPILILGIGSPIVSDDSVGLRVVEQIDSLQFEDLEVKEASTSGLDLIEMMLDHEMVIIVDGIVTKMKPPGSIFILSEENFASTVHGTNPHDVNIATAIELGRMLEPLRMPKHISFVAIEVIDTRTISEKMSPEVEKAIPKAVEVVLRLVGKRK